MTTISWPRAFISALPVVGIPLGISNVRYQDLTRTFLEAQKMREDGKELLSKANQELIQYETERTSFQGRSEDILLLLLNDPASSKSISQRLGEKGNGWVENTKQAITERRESISKLDTIIDKLKKSRTDLIENLKKVDAAASNLCARRISSAETIKIYARAAIMSHFLTLVALVILVSTGILSSPYLAIGTLNLAGLYFYSKKVGELENQIQNLRNLV